MVRGHDVAVAGNTLTIYMGPNDNDRDSAEKTTLQLLMYLDAEGFMTLGVADKKPTVTIKRL